MKRVLLFVSVVWLFGCESEAARAKRMADEQARAEKALFDQRRAEVLVSPGRYLETRDLAYFDKGIINDYRQLIGVTVTNRSAVPIRLTKGRVIWLSGEGNEVGASPLTFSGTLAPGAEIQFSTNSGNMTSGTIQGRAQKARIEFTEVEVIASAQQ